MLKYDPKAEVLVFKVVKELKEGTREEILDYLKEHENVEMDESTLLRYLYRFKAAKVFTIATRGEVEVWRLSDIPPWYASGIMAILKKTTNAEMAVELKTLNLRYKEGQPMEEKIPEWGNYHTFELTFETVDMILGGRPSAEGEERETQLTRQGGKLIVPANWLYGWIRDNQRLWDMVAVHYRVAVSAGEFIEEPKIKQVTLKVMKGLNTYEAIEPGAKFKVPKFRFPFRGCKIKTAEDLKKFLTEIGESPIRGLGANPRAFGGRVKLLDMKEVA